MFSLQPIKTWESRVNARGSTDKHIFFLHGSVNVVGPKNSPILRRSKSRRRSRPREMVNSSDADLPPFLAPLCFVSPSKWRYICSSYERPSQLFISHSVWSLTSCPHSFIDRHTRLSFLSSWWVSCWYVNMGGRGYCGSHGNTFLAKLGLCISCMHSLLQEVKMETDKCDIFCST